MYDMTDLRIKPRVLLLAVVIWTFVTYLILRSGGLTGCPATDDTRQSTHDDPAVRTLVDGAPATGSNIIYAITPTYARPSQKAELTRLAQTIMLQPNIHWILIEDALETTALVRDLLKRSGLQNRSTQLPTKTPTNHKLTPKDPNWSKPRGVEQRNAGLKWVREHVTAADMRNGGRDKSPPSVVFFMDDDNSYALGLFEEMRHIRRGKVGVWPVGLVGGLMVEKPVLDGGEVIGFNAAWRPERPFPVDMAGFAISTDLLVDYPKAMFSYEVQRGYQESEILRYLVTIRDLVPLAQDCTQVLVWHTRTEPTKLDAEVNLKKGKQPASNDGMEV